MEVIRNQRTGVGEVASTAVVSSATGGS